MSIRNLPKAEIQKRIDPTGVTSSTSGTAEVKTPDAREAGQA